MVVWWLPGPGGEEDMASYYLIGIEFQFCKMKTGLEIVSGDGNTT